MKIGFIGAGKVGFSLGKYLSENYFVSYFSRTYANASEAANFTKGIAYNLQEDLVKENDIIFLTVPDDKISSVWERIKSLSLESEINKKIFIHCSGLLDSTLFGKVQGYSLHPFLAISSKYESCKNLQTAHFTLEGKGKDISLIKNMFPNVYILETENKTLYHKSAVIASNFIVALAHASNCLLEESGFNNPQAVFDIMKNTIKNMENQGIVQALTGPVERGDTEIVKKHLKARGYNDLYITLSKELTEIAKLKNSQRDYEALEKILKKGIHRQA